MYQQYCLEVCVRARLDRTTSRALYGAHQWSRWKLVKYFREQIYCGVLMLRLCTASLFQCYHRGIGLPASPHPSVEYPDAGRTDLAWQDGVGKYAGHPLIVQPINYFVLYMPIGSARARNYFREMVAGPGTEAVYFTHYTTVAPGQNIIPKGTL